MAQTINTNIASLTAQRNLAASQKDAATAMQRLSSGILTWITLCDIPEKNNKDKI